MSFAERLKKFREEDLKLKTQKETADVFGISPSLYGMLERGERNPSKKILSFLVAFSSKPASYWLYGIEEQVKDRYSFLDKNVRELIDRGLIDRDGNFNADIESLLITALKIDIKNIVKENE